MGSLLTLSGLVAFTPPFAPFQQRFRRWQLGHDPLPKSFGFAQRLYTERAADFGRSWPEAFSLWSVH